MCGNSGNSHFPSSCMTKFTFTIDVPDAIVPDFLEALAEDYDYGAITASLQAEALIAGEQYALPAKKSFILQEMQKDVKEIYVRWKQDEARIQAAEAAKAQADSDFPL